MVVYVHIPFCVKKCAYCDFLSGQYHESVQRDYIKGLINEIKYYGNIYGSKGRGILVTSVFFGGGTPSLIKAEWIEEILEAIKSSYTLSDDAEITIESNPGTLTNEKLEIYKKAGINRLSIGLQSANNVELANIGRIHTYEEFLESFLLARETGFENINIDLMSALPGQTLESYKETLNKVIALKPEHISAYSLILEEGTCLYDKITKLEEEGRATGLPDEETERQMYYVTEEILNAAGYERYEISNYAKTGYECKHNTAYWRRENYLGVGLGAASCMDDIREKNITDIHKYIEIASNMLMGVNIDVRDLEERIELNKTDMMSEFMFLGLRLTRGISKTEFSKIFNAQYCDIYGGVTDKLMARGLIREYDNGDRISLTKLGMDVANQVFMEFLPE